MSLYENIHAKRRRIARGSGERMRKKGEKGSFTFFHIFHTFYYYWGKDV